MSGIFFAIISGVGFGVFQVVNRRAGRQMNLYLATFILLAVSAVVLAVASLLFEDVARLLRQATFLSVAYFALAGLIHFFVGWTLLSASQQRVGAARTGALLGATPLFAAVIGLIFFSEFLTLPTVVGILLVIGGVYLISTT